MDWVVEVALRSAAGRDDSQVLAWYRKFNLCMMSLFGTLWGFGGAVLCCFFAIEGRSHKSKAKSDDRPAPIAVTEPEPQLQHSKGMVVSIEWDRGVLNCSYIWRGPAVLSYIG